MAEPTIQLGGGNWAGKSDNLLGYYKEGERFYKQDFTFSRSTTGTYTDSEGYIQEMPYNLLQQSNDFDTTWNNYNSTETYDSNLDAWLIEKNGIYGFIRQFVTLSGEQTLSVYAKASTLNWLHIKGNGTLDNSAYFDLENGVLGSYNTTSASIESVGNGFYRCSITYSGDITDVRIYPADGNNDVSGTSGSVYIQNAQLVKGSSAKTYFPTTTRLNMPRVDYLNNSNGSLILEPQRTNLITYSEDFSEWSTIGSPTLTSNYGQSPDGLNNSTRVQFSSGDRIYISASLSGDISYSVYLKGNGTVRMRDNSGAYSNDVTLTNEWVRYDYTFNASISNVQLQQSSGTSDFEIYGAQVESGSYPTTLINTSGSSVTRNADVCSISNVADRIGQTEGVLYWEGENIGEQFAPYLGLFADAPNTNSTRVMIYYTSETTLNTQVRLNGVIQFTSGNATANGRVKVALAYKENDFVLYVNGSKISESSSGSTFTNELNNFNFNSAICKNYDLKIYNTRLSNSELATLTT